MTNSNEEAFHVIRSNWNNSPRPTNPDDSSSYILNFDAVKTAVHSDELEQSVKSYFSWIKNKKGGDDLTVLKIIKSKLSTTEDAPTILRTFILLLVRLKKLSQNDEGYKSIYKTYSAALNKSLRSEYIKLGGGWLSSNVTIFSPFSTYETTLNALLKRATEHDGASQEVLGLPKQYHLLIRGCN
ncbi:MAG: hypothetical protein COB66_06040 [Coxiella sp. (in: Bacteria)]|nr:MAG: hypothetical protein COB66_06040 [Coxiella sp. (in: g-proteobacteria)]